MASEDVPMWVKVSIGVVLFALAIGTTVGSVVWAMSKDSTSHDYVVESLIKTDQRHDRQLGEHSKEIAAVKEKQHLEEVARTKLEGKIDRSLDAQQATTVQITEMKNDFKEFSEFLMKFNYENKKDAK